MKKSSLLLALLLLFVAIATAQDAKAKKIDPAGKWKFEAPYAPEGYTSGVMNFSLTEKKYTSETSFTGSEYKIPGENVKVVNDSVKFVIYLEGQVIQISLKLEEPNKMTGNAVYSEGTVPLTLSRDNGTSPKAAETR